MEQRFNDNRLDLETLREFLDKPSGRAERCQREAERLNVHPNTISKIRRDITF